jgi:hypothetical protein
MDRSSLLVLTYALKAKDSVCQRIQSVIAADAYIKAGVDAGAALSVKDVAGLNELAVSFLSAKSLGIGITTVLGGSHSLFMGKELKVQI